MKYICMIVVFYTTIKFQSFSFVVKGNSGCPLFSEVLNAFKYGHLVDKMDQKILCAFVKFP